MKKIVKALIADDSLNVRDALVNLLSQIEGIDITGQARDVFQAIESIQKQKPDVVILDIMMPGGSGIDVLKYMLISFLTSQSNLERL